MTLDKTKTDLNILSNLFINLVINLFILAIYSFREQKYIVIDWYHNTCMCRCNILDSFCKLAQYIFC